MDREMLPLARLWASFAKFIGGPFSLNLPAGLFSGGCGGPDPGFFCGGSGGFFAGEGGPWAGAVPFPAAAALSNFLNDASDRRRSRKRGGDIKFISWDDWGGRIASRMSIPEQAAPILVAEQCSICDWAGPWWSGR